MNVNYVKIQENNNSLNDSGGLKINVTDENTLRPIPGLWLIYPIQETLVMLLKR